jgi:hypothetical protein
MDKNTKALMEKLEAMKERITAIEHHLGLDKSIRA